MASEQRKEDETVPVRAPSASRGGSATLLRTTSRGTAQDLTPTSAAAPPAPWRSAARATARKHRVSKGCAENLEASLHWWSEQGLLDPVTEHRLRASIEPIPFDWHVLAKYTMWMALMSFAIAAMAFFADEWVLRIIRQLLTLSDGGKAVGCFAAAGVTFYCALKRRGKFPWKTVTNEAIFFIGVLLVAVGVGFVGLALRSGSNNVHYLFLMAAVIYGVLGLLFPSVLVWVFALVAMGSWLGSAFGTDGFGMYFIHMDVPEMFVLFGMALLLVQVLMRSAPRWLNHTFGFSHCARATQIGGMVYLFLALWIISLRGVNNRFGYGYRYMGRSMLPEIPEILVFLASAVVAVVHGAYRDDAMTRGFGCVFGLLNLYTQFFRNFRHVHGSIFFGLLGASLWALSAHSERLWRAGDPLAAKLHLLASKPAPPVVARSTSSMEQPKAIHS